MPGLAQIVAVGAGGAIGAIGRYLLQCCFGSLSHHQWAVVAINLAGSALIGLAWAFVERHGTSLWANQLVIAGLLGGFTTYSTFAWDTFDLIRQGRTLEAASYVAVTLIGGILLCALTYYGGIKLFK